MKKITFLLSIMFCSLSFSQNLVTNGNFQSGAATPWYGNAANVVDLGGGNFVNQANVLAAGNPYDVNLSQNINLVSGTTYQLSFDAFTDATTGTRTMTVGLGQNNAPWVALTANTTLTSSLQTFTYTFTINYGETVADRVIFDMGAATGYVFIDNVSVTEVVNTCSNGIQDGTETGVDCGGTCAPCSTAAPTTNAPIPTRPQADVVSIFSDSYTNIATNLNPFWGQSGSVNPNFTVTSGNNILAYTNFNYQGTEVTATNLSSMEYLHIDVWSNANPANTILQVSPISNAGGASEFLVTINHVQGQWYSVDIPKSAFTGMTWTNVYQLKFAANGPGSTVPANFYFDNIYFWKTSVDPTADASLSDLKVDGSTIPGFGSTIQSYTYELLTGTTVVPQITSVTTTNASATYVISQATTLPGSATVTVTSANGSVISTYTVNFVVTGPSTNAPTPPARATSDVISLFSDAYTNIPVTEWSTPWDDSNIQDITLTGNAMKKINSGNFLGVQLANYVDASSMTHFHMDYYIDAGVNLVGKVLNPKWSNHAAQAGETSALLLTHLPTTTGSWVSIDVPLTSFAGAQSREALYQFLITSNLGSVYVDNIYLHKNTTMSSSSFTTSKVKLYPNPTANVLNIEATGDIQRISVYNVLGQEVVNKQSNGTSVSLDVSGLNTGVYVIKTMIEGNVSSTKFIKE